MIQYWEKAKFYLQKIDDIDTQKNLGHLLNNLGMAYFGIDNLEKAQIAFEQSIEIYKQIYGQEDISVGNRLNNLAETYRTNQQYNKALNCFKNALEIKQKYYDNQNNLSIANTYCNIGMTYQNLQEYTEAIQFFNKSLEIYKNIDTFEKSPSQQNDNQFKNDNTLEQANIENQTKNKENIMFSIYNCLGECYKSQNQAEQSAYFFQKAFEIKKQNTGFLNDKTLRTMVSYAQQLFKSEQYEESKQVFLELLKGSKQFYGEQSIQVGQIYNNLGTVLNSLREYDEAINCFNLSIQLLQKSGTVSSLYIEKIQTYIQKIQNKMQQQSSNQTSDLKFSIASTSQKQISNNIMIRNQDSIKDNNTYLPEEDQNIKQNGSINSQNNIQKDQSKQILNENSPKQRNGIQEKILLNENDEIINGNYQQKINQTTEEMKEEKIELEENVQKQNIL